jgi:hypothetical protein
VVSEQGSSVAWVNAPMRRIVNSRDGCSGIEKFAALKRNNLILNQTNLPKLHLARGCQHLLYTAYSPRQQAFLS